MGPGRGNIAEDSSQDRGPWAGGEVTFLAVCGPTPLGSLILHGGVGFVASLCLGLLHKTLVKTQTLSLGFQNLLRT